MVGNTRKHSETLGTARNRSEPLGSARKLWGRVKYCRDAGPARSLNSVKPRFSLIPSFHQLFLTLSDVFAFSSSTIASFHNRGRTCPNDEAGYSSGRRGE